MNRETENETVRHSAGRSGCKERRRQRRHLPTFRRAPRRDVESDSNELGKSAALQVRNPDKVGGEQESRENSTLTTPAGQALRAFDLWAAIEMRTKPRGLPISIKASRILVTEAVRGRRRCVFGANFATMTKMDVSSLAACTFIVLHNVHDMRSRAFVDAMPKDLANCVVDWYGDPQARFAYDGPPPNAFPSVGKKLPDGRFVLARTPKDFSAIEKLDIGDGGHNSFESMSNTGSYIGGLQIWEAVNLVKWGYPTDAEERAILAGLKRIGKPISAKVLAAAHKQRPNFAQTPGIAECESAGGESPDSWARTARTANCLLDSANRQFAQLLVGNVAGRDPERFVRELGEIAKKKEAGDYLKRMLSTEKFLGKESLPPRP